MFFFSNLVTNYGTCPLSRCYHDKMTLESLLNQFKSENSLLGRRTYPDKYMYGNVAVFSIPGAAPTSSHVSPMWIGV